jgi:zinc transporter, ZIP family
VLGAAFWGFVGGFALLAGAVLGLVLGTPPRVFGIVMAFGAGVLGGASPATTAVVQAFTAGAILTMPADPMVPEGFEHPETQWGW